MAVDVFLNFNGNCRDAVKFYTKVFGLEEPKIMTYGEAPPEVQKHFAEETKNLVMYTSLKILSSTVMLSDTPPGMSIIQGNNINLTIVSKDMDEIKSLFNRMKEGGTILMDLGETFWSKCYGMLTDKYGIPWQFVHDSGLMEF